MEQLVLLLVIGLISLINFLMKRSAEMREKRRLERARDRGEPVGQTLEGGSDPSESPEAEPTEDPAESMRKLMEALGLPVEEAPPQRREPPPIPHAREQTAPAFPVARERGAVRETPFVRPEPDPIIETAPPIIKMPEPTPRQQKRRRQPAPAAPVSRSRVRQMLDSPAGLRDAIILSEVLGPPRGLR